MDTIFSGTPVLKRKRLEFENEDDSILNTEFKKQKTSIEDERIANDSTVDNIYQKKSSAPVWQFFKKDPSLLNKAKCCICDQPVANNNGTTTMLNKHIQKAHKTEYEKLSHILLSIYIYV